VEGGYARPTLPRAGARTGVEAGRRCAVGRSCRVARRVRGAVPKQCQFVTACSQWP